MKYSKLIGFLISIVAIGFVLHKVFINKIWEVDPGVISGLFTIGVAGIIVYSSSWFFLTMAWCLLIRTMRTTEHLTFADSVEIYGKTQIAKYIPGNFFHLASRQVHGHRAGIAHNTLIWGTVLESAVFIGASTVISVPGLHTLTSVLPDIGTTLPILISLGITLLLPFGPICLSRFSISGKLFPETSSLAKYFLHIWLSILLSCLFFIASAVILYLILSIVMFYADYHHAEKIHMFKMVLPLTALSWLIGYITPGASAGIGIRDAIIIMALIPEIGESSSTLVAMAFRMIITLGDLLFFGLSLRYVRRR